MLGAMVASTVAVVLVGARRSDPPRPAPAPARPHETPWLTPDAAAQVIGPGGRLGPLFDGTSFGEPVPADVRARIATFARANRVAIDLEVSDGELAAIRFEVSYGGCCGYEGADVLALRLERPHTGGCCVCGPDTWIDDWALVTDDGVYVRARVRVNRVVVRWERAWSAPEIVEHADQLLGQSAAVVRARSGDRWFDQPVVRRRCARLSERAGDARTSSAESCGRGGSVTGRSRPTPMPSGRR